MSTYQKSILPNGIRVVTEKHSGSRALCAGLWVGTGSRDEVKGLEGVSHFLEHLVFKGTRTRSAFELARVMEAVGGDLNAHTTREYTCYHATSLKEHLSLNLDVLQDIICRATFPKEEFEKEKQVVLQEIASSYDNLEEAVFDLFFEEVYKGHPLSIPILGTEESIGNIKRQQVVDYYQGRYSGSNLIVSVAGNVEHQAVVDCLEPLSRVKKRGRPSQRRKPRFRSFAKVIPRESEQAHIVIGIPAASYMDKYRFESFILNALLGGGMTSKLYQNIREKRGLAYSVYSYLAAETDSGLCMIYLATDKRFVRKSIELVAQSLGRIRERLIPKSELKLFTTQVRGGILLGADDIENRMNSLGVNEMVFGEYRSVDRIVSEIESVTRESFSDYVKEYAPGEKLSVLVLGSVFDRDAQWIESRRWE